MSTYDGFPWNQPAALMREIESLEVAIGALQNIANPQLAINAASLTDALERRMRYLDALTRPLSPRVIYAGRRETPGFEYAGTFHFHWNAIDIYRAVLRKLWEDHPDRRQAMAAALSARGSMRCYVARDRVRLFPLGYSNGWINKFSESLVDGWYLDTNLNNERKQLLCRVAITAAGLNVGTDVRIVWP